MFHLTQLPDQPAIYYHASADQAVFLRREDFQKYLKLLSGSKQKYSFQLLAYSLTTSDVHLLIEPGSFPPEKIIHFIHHQYAFYIKKKYGISRPVFSDSRTLPVLNTRSCLEICKYIHLFPFLTERCSRPLLYRWNSYQAYILNTSLDLTDKSLIYSYFPLETQSSMQEFHEREISLFASPVDMKSFLAAYVETAFQFALGFNTPGISQTFLLSSPAPERG
ncbi:hypothetical protein [Alkalicoccus halolimnae]|uniref:Transposase IS200-like domain-containing protein n=1 Tax=Alkalicoccus halolimnae TaxID=1667239 RepID=A0A5C7FH52_9BACI|nr:hypothetical protein [Alkalicoccus halolimnae]TXF85614.1 hypothetical protein FTX54_08475 [Alkalicoccus halolimnae]